MFTLFSLTWRCIGCWNHETKICKSHPRGNVYFTSYTKLFSTCRIGTWREDYLGKSIEPDFRRGNNDQVPSKAHSNSESSSYLVQCNPEQWDRIRMNSHGEIVRATTQPSLAQMDSLEDYIRWNLDIVLASGWTRNPKENSWPKDVNGSNMTQERDWIKRAPY